MMLLPACLLQRGGDHKQLAAEPDESVPATTTTTPDAAIHEPATEAHDAPE
jgi:hypothetical protein